ncbi:hypothetical protein ASU31_22605 [Pedobacter ginsenosidimutans]|uniref:Uncharacterized protein n=1 Tax=Pedobacter ginsenosidimutans TaxID=687842 RepID=A0A0T5VIY6_9SPHI|nr:hypothetical protein [Pedobacter ginsenosidimutans]KRT13830.1 hypothetical protein ASU31_22605 [Pedobacter ginsenosidimutans]
MKPKELIRKSELEQKRENYKYEEPAKPSVTCYAIYQQAKAAKHWIYDPEIKRWQTPEEFLELEKRISGGESKRLERLQIKDPMMGIDAAYEQLQSLKDRMEVFVKKVIIYYK